MVDALASVLVFSLPGVVSAFSRVGVLILVETDPRPSFHKTKCHPLRSPTDRLCRRASCLLEIYEGGALLV